MSGPGARPAGRHAAFSDHHLGDSAPREATEAGAAEGQGDFWAQKNIITVYGDR